MPDTPRIRTAITEYSKRTEDVLVMLLQVNYLSKIVQDCPGLTLTWPTYHLLL